MKPRDLTLDLDRDIGARLRFWRQQRRKTQEQLAAELGVTFQQIQKYESGKNRLTASRLHRIAALLGVPIGDFYSPSPLNAALTPITEETELRAAGEIKKLLSHFAQIETPKKRAIVIAMAKLLSGGS